MLEVVQSKPRKKKKKIEVQSKTHAYKKEKQNSNYKISQVDINAWGYHIFQAK
jgi:hypothetical protein